MDYGFLGQLLLNGIVIGLIYGLIATGLALQFGILHIVNFAHGEFLMIAMYAMAVLLPLMGGSYLPAFLLLIVLAILVGGLFSRSFFAALQSTSDQAHIFERSVLLTLGLSIIALNGVQYAFTASPQMVTTNIGYGAFTFGEIRLTHAHALAGSVAIATFIALYVFLMHTNAGRALRAVAQNREAAVMIGLDPMRVAGHAIAISIVLSAIAGAVLVPIYVFQPSVGQAFLLKAFAIVIIGGMGSVLGAAVAALGLGILESVVGGFTNIVWQNAIAFIAMIAVLALFPRGVLVREMRKG